MPEGDPFGYARSRMRPQARRDRRVGTEAEDEFRQRIGDFDAAEAARDVGRAQFEAVEEDLTRNVRDLRGSQVGRGRIRTGFGFEEEDELVGDTLDELARALAANSFRAAGLNLRATEDLGGYGERTTNRFLETVASERDAALLEEEMRRREEAAKRGGLFHALGTLAGGTIGFATGGPLGILPGASAGSQLFD